MSLEFLVKDHAWLKEQGSAEWQLTFPADVATEFYFRRETFLTDSQGRGFPGFLISN